MGKLALLRISAAIVSVPALEFVGWHFLLKHVLRIGFGDGAWVESGALLMPIAWVMLLARLQDGSILELRLSTKRSLVHVAFIALCVMALFSLDESQAQTAWARTTFRTLGLISGFTSLFLFVSPAEWLSRLSTHRRAVIFALGACAALLVNYSLRPLLWSGPLAEITGDALRALFAVLPFPVNVIFRTDHLEIWNHSAMLYVYSPCSGLEGVGLFLFVCCLMQIQEPMSFSRSRWIGVLLGGIFWMLALNVIRIGWIVGYGFLVLHRSNDFEKYQSTVDFFHSNSGWLLYFVGIFLFVSLFFPVKPLIDSRTER